MAGIEDYVMAFHRDCGGIIIGELGTGKTTWTDQSSKANVVYDGGAAQLYGEDSWKSLLLQPVM